MDPTHVTNRIAEARKDPKRAKRIDNEKEKALREIHEYEVGLGQLRHALHLTQQQLARALEVSQAQISRIEHQSDLILSTLRSYLRAMGADLELVAVFDSEHEGDDQVRISITLSKAIEEAPEGGDVPDLMAALEASLAEARRTAREIEERGFERLEGSAQARSYK